MKSLGGGSATQPVMRDIDVPETSYSFRRFDDVPGTDRVGALPNLRTGGCGVPHARRVWGAFCSSCGA